MDAVRRGDMFEGRLPRYLRRLPENTPVYMVNLTGCARCLGGGHPQLAFAPLTHPMAAEDGSEPFTHWAPCPANGEPILLRHVERPSAAATFDRALERDRQRAPARTRRLRSEIRRGYAYAIAAAALALFVAFLVLAHVGGA